MPGPSARAGSSEQASRHPAAASEPRSADRPRLIAHRGFADEFPENTAAAVQKAASRADAVEIDLRQCRCGTVVTAHDATIGGLRRQRLDRTTYDRLAELAGDRIPSLQAVLDAVPPDTGLVLELKDSSVLDRVATQISGVDSPIVISSPAPEPLCHVKRTVSGIETALLHIPPLHHRVLWPLVRRTRRGLERLVDVRGLVEAATDAECDRLHARYELCLHSDIVERAHAAGLEVDAWTVPSPDVYRALTAIGVDGIIADSWRIRTDR